MSDFLITQNCSANLHEGYRGGMGTEQFNRNIETFLYGPGRTDVMNDTFCSNILLLPSSVFVVYEWSMLGYDSFHILCCY